jgi:hypothetical protein
MASLKINKISDFSASSIKFSDVQQNKMGGKAIYLNSADGGKVLLKLPPMKAIVGISPYYADKTTKKNVQNYKMPLSLTDPAAVAFFAELDKAVLAHIQANEAKFFGGKKTLKDMMVNYKPFVQPSEKAEYAPLLKTNVIWNKDSNKFETQFYDSKGIDIDPEELVEKRGTTVTTLIQLGQIYNTPAGFGLSIRLVQVKVASQAKLSARALLDDPEEKEQSVGDGEDEEEYEEDDGEDE